jgi:hypothetical protein
LLRLSRDGREAREAGNLLAAARRLTTGGTARASRAQDSPAFACSPWPRRASRSEWADLHDAVFGPRDDPEQARAATCD